VKLFIMALLLAVSLACNIGQFLGDEANRTFGEYSRWEITSLRTKNDALKSELQVATAVNTWIMKQTGILYKERD
jgi:hypothetical protein